MTKKNETIIPSRDSKYKNLNKFLYDCKITPEQKMLYFRLIKNPHLETLISNTRISEFFEILEEYKKHPNLYDDIFNEKVKLIIKDGNEKSFAIFDPKKIKPKSSLKMYMSQNTLAGEVVERFSTCNTANDIIKKLSINLHEDELIMSGFNHKNKLVNMVIDLLTGKIEDSIIINFLRLTKNQRIDLVRF